MRPSWFRFSLAAIFVITALLSMALGAWRWYRLNYGDLSPPMITCRYILSPDAAGKPDAIAMLSVQWRHPFTVTLAGEHETAGRPPAILSQARIASQPAGDAYSVDLIVSYVDGEFSVGDIHAGVPNDLVKFADQMSEGRTAKKLAQEITSRHVALGSRNSVLRCWQVSKDGAQQQTSLVLGVAEAQNSDEAPLQAAGAPGPN